MKKMLIVYAMCIKNDVVSQVSYKKDFIIQLVVWSIYAFVPFLAIAMLIQSFPILDDFGIYEAAVLYGVVTIAYDFSRMIARGFDDFSQLLLSGDLDIYYVRPQPILLQILGSRLFLRRLAGIVQGIGILIWGLVHFTFQVVILLFILYIIILTIIVYTSLFMIYSAICFYTIKDSLFSDMIIESSATLGYYPIEHMNRPIRFIFGYIIPIALCVYRPLHPIFINQGISFSTVFIATIASFSILTLSVVLFHFAKNKYKSVNN